MWEGSFRAMASGPRSNGVTAHRGASGEHPENTLLSFAAGITAGADWLECDAHLTADGHVVVIHDARTGCTGDVDVVVADTSLAELQLVDVATAFRVHRGLSLDQCGKHTIPLLSEVLELVMQSKSGVRLSIQPKAHCVPQICAVVLGLGAHEYVGFNDDSLSLMTEARVLIPEVTIFWDRVWGYPSEPPASDTQLEEDIAVAIEQRFECIVLYKESCSCDAVAAIHAAGLLAGVWTLDEEDPPEMVRYAEMGLDRFYTDHPSMMLDTLATRTSTHKSST